MIRNWLMCFLKCKRYNYCDGSRHAEWLEKDRVPGHYQIVNRLRTRPKFVEPGRIITRDQRANFPKTDSLCSHKYLESMGIQLDRKVNNKAFDVYRCYRCSELIKIDCFLLSAAPKTERMK